MNKLIFFFSVLTVIGFLTWWFLKSVRETNKEILANRKSKKANLFK